MNPKNQGPSQNQNGQNQKPKAAPFEAAPPPPAPEAAQIPYVASNGNNGAAASAPFAAFQMPNAFRDMAEKSVTQARDTYAKMKTAAEDTTDMIETTVEAARDGVMALGVKALDAAKTNSDASFALARDLFGAKTLSQVIELQSGYARRLFESMTSQFKELQALTEKVVSDTTKPVTDKVEKNLKAVA